MLDQAGGATEQGAFYIQATGPSSRPRHTLKQGNTFAVCDSHGDIGASPGGPDGLFNNDTRFLSRLELLINGTQPLLLGSRIRDDNISLSVDLTNPDIYRNGQIVCSGTRSTWSAQCTFGATSRISASTSAISARGASSSRFPCPMTVISSTCSRPAERSARSGASSPRRGWTATLSCSTMRASTISRARPR